MHEISRPPIAKNHRSLVAEGSQETTGESVAALLSEYDRQRNPAALIADLHQAFLLGKVFCGLDSNQNGTTKLRMTTQRPELALPIYDFGPEFTAMFDAMPYARQALSERTLIAPAEKFAIMHSTMDDGWFQDYHRDVVTERVYLCHYEADLLRIQQLECEFLPDGKSICYGRGRARWFFPDRMIVCQEQRIELYCADPQNRFQNEDEQRIDETWATEICNVVTASMWLLSNPSVSSEPSTQRSPEMNAINQRRTKAGKLTIPPVSVVRLTRPMILPADGPRGTHASPRGHSRREHRRILRSGRAVIVRKHDVNGGGPPQIYVVTL